MVHTRVSDKYIHFSLMYATDHIFLVLPIKHLVNQDSETTTPHKLETGTKPSISNLRILFCPCVVQKPSAHVDIKVLNMHHQSQKVFHGIFVGIPQHQKGTSSMYLVHRKYFLHMMLYWIKTNLLHEHKRHLRIQTHSLCDQKSCILRKLHHLMNKMATL